MGRYVARRLALAIPLLLGISVVSFAILRAVPGGPLAAYEGDPSVSAADLARLEAALGLDRPLPVQYLSWLARFVTGDWGYSLTSHQPVLALIGERLPNTIYLMGTVFVGTIALSLPIGVLAAVRRGSAFDHITSVASFALLSTPTFWLGLLLVIAFGLQLRVFPLAGIATPGAPFDVADRLRHLVLPAATLALVQAASHVRYLRSSMLDTLGEDYVRTARGKGLAERAIASRHALRNAALPYVTVVALDVPELFAGALVAEQIFGWPGMGRLFWDAATRSDHPVLMAILAVSATLVVLANVAADILYGYLDPRIRY